MIKTLVVEVLLLMALGLACGAPPASESLEGIGESCEHYCGTLLYCPYNQVSGETEYDIDDRVEKCAQSCSSDAEEGASIGDPCAESFGSAIRCFAELDCDAHRLRGMPEVYTCESELRALLSDCPGVWGNADQ